MGLNINLFVHGVPMGQKIWGPKGDDERYLSSFYGPKWDAPEVMKIDVMTFGGITQCYYSFVKGQNVCDSQGRAGSYFALTLRINAFYADVQNMYNILKAVYDKMCVGLCIQDNNSSAKYMLADFQSIDSKLKDIEKHVLNYISEFSISEDIISLSGFSSNSQASVQAVNLFECRSKVAFDIVKKTGKLSVSPCYLSASAATKVAQYKADMETTKQKAQQEIQMQQNAAKERIASITRQLNERVDSITRSSQEELRACKEDSRSRLAQAKEENDRRIAEIKESYSDVDNKINSLKTTIKERDREIGDLDQQNKKKDKEIKAINANVEILQNTVTKLQADLESYRAEGGFQPLMPEPKRINWMIVSTVSFFIALLVGLLSFFVIRYVISNKDTIKLLNEEVAQLTMANDSLRNSVVEGNSIDVPVLPEGLDYSKLKIDIQEFGKKKQAISHQEICHINLQGNSALDLQGKWISEGLIIIGDSSIMVKDDYKGSSCTLSYVLGKDTIASRVINIQ